MNPTTPRLQGWRAAELAGNDRWIFDAKPGLTESTPQELAAWLVPVVTELKYGWGVAWIRGLGELP
jgi:hypothetical protein